MSWTDQEIDDLAKKASADMNFTYDPAFFKEAEAMLPKRKKKAFLWWWMSAAAVLIIGLLTFIGFNGLGTNEEAKVSTAESRRVASEAESSSEKDVSVVNEETVTQEKNFGADEEANAPISTEGAKEMQNTSSENTVSSKAQTSERLEDGGLKTNILSNKSPKEKDVVTRDVQVKSPVLIPEKKEGASTATVVSNPEIVPLVDQMTSSVVRTQITNVLSENTIPVIPVDGLDRKAINLPILTIGVQRELDDITYRYRRLGAYSQLRVMAGQSLVNEQQNMTRSFGLGLGAYYNFGRSSINAGVELQYQSLNLNLLERSEVYGFDLTYYENRMNYTELYMVNFPVSYTYHIRRSQLQLGIAANMLLGSKMNYDLRENGTSRRSQTLYNERKGITSYGFSSMFSYGYQLNSLWSVGLGLEWQMIEQVDQNLTERKIVKPLSGHIYLRKQFGRR